MRSEAVAKSRAELLPTILQIQAAGATTLRAIAELNAREIELHAAVIGPPSRSSA